MYVSASQAQAAADVLGLELTASVEDVGQAYRAASKTCHPDSGAYDAIRWANITAAKQTLEQWITQRANADKKLTGPGNCRACNGVGYTSGPTRAFRAGPRIFCVICNGTGQRNDR